MRDEQLLDNIVIIFDTNVWLDIYKLPPITIQYIVQAIEDNIDSFWLPNQVYIEYNRNQKKNRDYAINRFKNIKQFSGESLSNMRDKINQEFVNLRNSELLNAKQLHREFEKAIKDIRKLLKKGFEKIDDDYQKDVKCISEEYDIVQSLIEKMYEEKDSKGFSVKELMKIYEEGEVRYKYNIAPGFTDNDKSEVDYSIRFGDLIIWKEILLRIENYPANMIFVQNEKKSDWWKSYEKKIPSDVLTEEFENICNNNESFKMIDFTDFLKNYGNSLGLKVSTIRKLISHINYEKAVNQYLLSKHVDILESNINKYFIGSLLKTKIEALSFFGGSFDSIEKSKIMKFNILSSEIDLDIFGRSNSVLFNVELEVESNLKEYINKYELHIGKVILKFNLTIKLNFSIDINNFEAEIEKSIIFEKPIFENIELYDSNVGEYLIELKENMRISEINERYISLKSKLGKIPNVMDLEIHDPLVFVQIIDTHSLKSYYNYLTMHEAQFQKDFYGLKALFIEFISVKFLKGKRPHELLVLKAILNNESDVFSYMVDKLENTFKINVKKKSLISVVNNLTNEFATGSSKKIYSKCIFIEKKSEEYVASEVFKECISDIAFKNELSEMTNVGLLRYEKYYGEPYKKSSFQLYQKYTYEDVCRLLEWEKNVVSLSIGGYKYDEKSKTYPIFINYHESDTVSDTLKYEDRFLSNNSIKVISKAKRTIDSTDIVTAYNARELGVDIELFVRKHMRESRSKEFYYLGRVHTVGKPKGIKMNENGPNAVELTYQLETRIREDIYEYLTGKEV